MLAVRHDSDGDPHSVGSQVGPGVENPVPEERNVTNYRIRVGLNARFDGSDLLIHLCVVSIESLGNGDPAFINVEFDPSAGFHC